MRRAAGNHSCYQSPFRFRQPQVAGRFLIHRAHLNANPRAYTVNTVFQIFKHTLNSARWDRKTNTLSLSVNSRVDPNYFTLQVEQRPATVAGVNGSICLKQVFILPVAYINWSAFGTNHSGRYSMIQSIGVSNSDHPIAHPNLVGIAKI
ncbi:MAG: hypothetical protein A4E52_02115 [Pelotomaculum sp. PtaB.Bin013]|nr:MAG: hypothetical protein A4E52_02115 [Pelotomaculum sp. PtaB.Bin013]